jgi:hypothetical protein
MRLFISILFLGLFAPGLVLAQDVVISGKDFESGAGDAKLAEIARQAAASGKTIVITTPPYWQDKAAAKLRATSPDVHVKTSDAFFENVIVRIVGTDKPEKAAKPPEPIPAAKPIEAPPAVIAKAAPRAEPKPVAPPVPVIKAPPSAPEQKAAVATAAPAARVESAPVVATVASTARPAAAVPPPAATVEFPSAPAPAASAPPAPIVASIAPPASAVAPAVQHPEANTADLRRKFESQLNLGKSAEGTIKPAQLQKGDEIFVKGPLRAVVRRFGSRVQLFWLEGALNVERAELSMKDPGHFTVNDSIRDVANPSLRAMHLEPKMFAAVVPVEKSAVRTDMERHFNDSHAIPESLHPDQLQYGDLFYIYRTYAVVFRRTDQGFYHYWLDGSVDLNQAGIVHDGDAYRLVSDRL